MDPNPIPDLAPPGASRTERFALRILQAGAIAAVLATSIFLSFELDRFFVPKELVLHLVALMAAVALARQIVRSASQRIDLLLVAYAALSCVSAALATNRWLALRAVTITASSILLFWCGRVLHAARLETKVSGGLAAAVVAAAITCLAQAYGLSTLLFSENRSPGGTLGNRNFVAHLAAFGFPLLVHSAIHAATWRRAFVWAAATAATMGALVLTRSRAAWLAFIAVLAVLIVGIIASRVLRRSGRVWSRLALVALFGVGGAAIVLTLPNALHWRERDPYLRTISRVAEYQEGSGHGRLVQYRRSLLLAARHPFLGTGPGNWAVEYPAGVPADDPSLNDADPGMTMNPWPSSDWIAAISERGLAAAALLGLVCVLLAMTSAAQLRRAADPDDAIRAVAALSVVAGLCVTGAFDAVLLLGLPSLIGWVAVGALSEREAGHETLAGRPGLRVVAVVALIALAGTGVVRSACELDAMRLAAFGDRRSLERAVAIDPGAYRLQMRLARGGSRTRCSHAAAAHALFPTARAAAEALRGCR